METDRALIAGAPYKLLQWLGVPVTGLLMLLVPRVLLCVLSFTIGTRAIFNLVMKSRS